MRQETEIKRLVKLNKVQVIAAGKLKLDIYEVKKVLYHTTNIAGISSEVLEGLVLVNGKTKTCVCFVDGENTLRVEVFETTFETKIENAAIDISSQIVSSQGNILDNELTISNNDEINIKSALEVCISIAKTEKIATKTPDDENLIVKNEQLDVLGLTGFGKYDFNQDVALKCKDDVKEVLSIFASPLVENIEIKNSVAVAGGRVEIKVVYLTNEEDSQIKTVTDSYPFSEEITQTDDSYVCGCVSNTRCSADSIIDGSEIKLNVKTELNYEIFSKTSLNMATDAFGLKNNVNLTYSSFETTINSDKFNFKDEVTGNVNLKTDGAIKVLGLVPKEVIVASVYKDGSYITVEGVVKVNSLYEETKMYDGIEEKALNAAEVEIPFSLKAKNSMSEAENLAAEVKFARTEIKQLYNTEAKINCELFVSIGASETKTLGYVSNIDMGEELPEKNSSLSLYIGAAGDDMWKICKKLKVNEETIMQQNPDINSEDLRGKQIVIYRQRSVL